MIPIWWRIVRRIESRSKKVPTISPVNSFIPFFTYRSLKRIDHRLYTTQLQPCSFSPSHLATFSPQLLFSLICSNYSLRCMSFLWLLTSFVFGLVPIWSSAPSQNPCSIHLFNQTNQLTNAKYWQDSHDLPHCMFLFLRSSFWPLFFFWVWYQEWRKIPRFPWSQMW